MDRTSGFGPDGEGSNPSGGTLIAFVAQLARAADL